MEHSLTGPNHLCCHVCYIRLLVKGQRKILERNRYSGDRGASTARDFMEDVAGRITNRIQLTTDGHRVYAEAVEQAFGSEIDYAMLVKIYGASNEGESRYSPASCIGCRTGVLAGNPDPKHISTSFVERQNLSMRMGMRRFTRLSNGFSKKLENHGHMVAMYFMHYNFC